MSSSRLARTAVAATAAALFAVGCGAGSDEAVVEETAAPNTASVTDSQPATTSDASGAEVPAILQFSSPLVGGGELDAATLAGKPTAFWFWAPT